MRCRRTYARCLLGEGAALDLAVRTRRAALIAFSLCLMQVQSASERPVFFGARQWCDVKATVSNAKPALRVLHGTGVPNLAVSGEEAKH